MRLVDVDALKAIRFHDLPYSQIVSADCDTDEKVSAYKLGWNDAIDAIVESVPTVDPIKHGHWINANEGIWNTVDVLKCSVCGEIDNRMYRSDAYCPYCGAKMDEVEEDG